MEACDKRCISNTLLWMQGTTNNCRFCLISGKDMDDYSITGLSVGFRLCPQELLRRSRRRWALAPGVISKERAVAQSKAADCGRGSVLWRPELLQALILGLEMSQMPLWYLSTLHQWQWDHLLVCLPSKHNPTQSQAALLLLYEELIIWNVCLSLRHCPLDVCPGCLKIAVLAGGWTQMLFCLWCLKPSTQLLSHGVPPSIQKRVYCNTDW